jgi:hypothetical protein
VLPPSPSSARFAGVLLLQAKSETAADVSTKQAVNENRLRITLF